MHIHTVNACCIISVHQRYELGLQLTLTTCDLCKYYTLSLVSVLCNLSERVGSPCVTLYSSSSHTAPASDDFGETGSWRKYSLLLSLMSPGYSASTL